MCVGLVVSFATFGSYVASRLKLGKHALIPILLQLALGDFITVDSHKDKLETLPIRCCPHFSHTALNVSTANSSAQ